MFEFVMKILDKSKEKMVDLSVATAMVKSDFPEDIDTINAAFNIIDKYYKEITAFRRDGSAEDIAEFVAIIESGDKEQLAKYLEDHEEFFKESFDKAKKD